jgi:hypothetical protein
MGAVKSGDLPENQGIPDIKTKGSPIVGEGWFGIRWPQNGSNPSSIVPGDKNQGIPDIKTKGSPIVGH